MHISLELPKTRLRRWHLWLINELKQRSNCAVTIHLHDGARQVPAALSLLLQLEKLTQRHGADSGSDTISQADVMARTAPSPNTPDLTIHLGSDASERARPTPAPTLTLTFDGNPHEDVLWDALLHRRVPLVTTIVTSTLENSHPGTATSILPAVEAPHLLGPSADAVMSRAIELIVHQVLQHSEAQAARTPKTPAVERTQNVDSRAQTFAWAAPAFLARRVRDKAKSVLSKAIKSAPQWQVAWRPRQHLNPTGRTRLSLSTFHLLPDDGQRFFADPFPIEHRGTIYLFVEEYPYATERGLISVVTIDPSGEASTPRAVLETESHLSYPQVFAHDGAMWMLPESAASGGVDLYRATDFPGGWQPVARLIDEPLHDATLHQDGTGWWLFASSTFLKSSSWCALKVYFANELLGPWHPVQPYPVKVDARSSRPAGRLVIEDGALWRPTQDCSSGYGHGLAWCQVDTLTREGYGETPRGGMRFDAESVLGPHTWTATNTFETVDVFAVRAKPLSDP